ncbi:MAG: T9SS type A sorting domain-containing protein [bacterium]
MWQNEEWMEIEGLLEYSFEDSYGNNFGFSSYKLDIIWKKTTSAVINVDNDFSINTFPNPFINSITLSYNLAVPSNVKINIFNNLGNIITTVDEGSINTGRHQATFEVSNLPAGIYYYTIRIGERIENGKFIKCI